jgi:proteasome lid subunit RPN8/RPN11
MDVTREHIREHGAQRHEAALCWAGTVAEGRALVTTTLLFTTAAHRAGVHVSSAQTGLLYAHCHARGLTLLAQVHSHPGDAFHSVVDERSPHSAERGFLSMVVPNFGRCAFDAFDAWAIYEQEQYETWREWTTEEKEQRLKIVDSLVVIP